MANIEVVNAQPEFFGIIDGSKSYLYEELWKLCAGPLADLPKVGEKIYYFPQGHKEQLEASTKEYLDEVKPLFDLPSKLRCRVMSIRLEVENDTDEVYAQITLIPDTTQINIPIANGNQQRPIVHSFIKVLTASDTNGHSGFSILRKHATECLPPLDMTQLIPSQEIVTKDLHGYEWRFKHIFRGTPRRHLFTSGWSAFVTSKRLVAGDCFIFLVGENGQLRVGIRKAVHQQGNKLSSVISPQSMHHGVIASALHAFNTQCMFIVNYKPRTSQFVVSFDKYVDAMNNKFNVGSRFKMRFEDEDFNERRYSGTVVKVEDFSPHWKDSEWRSLKVHWDDHASILRPDKVSPWEIEHLVSSSGVPQTALLKNKRFRQIAEIGSTSSNLWSPTLTQGQEIEKSSIGSPVSIPQLTYRDAVEESNIPYGWPMMSSYSVPTMPKLNNNDQMILPMKEKITTDGTASCRLFGVDLVLASPSETKDPIGPINSYYKSEISKLSEEKKLDQALTLTSPEEVQSNQIGSRSCTKVQMQDLDVSRAVDLTILGGYNQLIEELDNLFDLKGELQTRNQWEIVFTDNEGDMMLVGDDPWPEFCNMVKKIFIYSKEEVEKMKPGNNVYVDESTLTCSDVPPNVKADNLSN